MSELRSAIDGIGAAVLPELPDVLIEETFEELQRASELLELQRLRYLGEIERRQLFARDGHLSVGAWMSQRFGVARGPAAGAAKLARALDQMPATRRAVEAGDVSLSSARALVAARDVSPEAFSRDEDLLVEAARRHRLEELQRVVTFWRQRVEHDRGDDPEEVLRSRRSLHASRSFEGMVRVDGDLDPECGELLLTAIGAVVDAGARSDREDRRTPTQRRADALGEICRQWLDLADRPTVAGERPHLVVTVDVGKLQDLGTGVATLDRTGPVPVEVARRPAATPR